MEDNKGTWHCNLKYDHSPSDREIIEDFHCIFSDEKYVFHEFQKKLISEHNLGYDGIMFNAKVEIIFLKPNS